MSDAATVPGAVPAGLEALDSAGVRWCVWKGSTHLAESLSGAGDVDVVLEPGADRELVGRCLRGAGLRRAHVRCGAGAFLEDWFGLAPGSGALVHLQVYESVVVDDGLAGRWLLPAAADLVAGRRASTGGCWTPQPAQEAALAVIQAAARRGGPIRRWLVRTKRPLDHRLAALGSPVLDAEGASVVAAWTGSPEAAAVVCSVLAAGQGRAAQLDELARLLDRSCAVAPDRLAATARAVSMAVRRRALSSSDRHPRSRVLGPPGCAVALVGSDGAGKSSTVQCLVEDYRGKVDTTQVYFGSGDGRSLLPMRPFKVARGLVAAADGPGSGSRPNVSDVAVPGPAKAVWAVALTLERLAKARRLARARAGGSLVICDRLPQASVPGIHDGPRLGPMPTDAARWIRAVSGWEQRAYESFRGAPVDLVVRLRVSPAVAAARRPDHDPTDLRRRIEVVAELDYGRTTVDVDADASVDAVRRAVRLAVFEALP